MSVAVHKLGEFIEVCNKRNSDLRYGIELIEGVNSDGEFCPPKACTDGIDLKPYKIVNPGDFVYNPSRLNIGSLSYRTAPMCIVSHLYVVFHLTEYGKSKLLPEYLWMFFNREEFRRLITYRNFGSQRPEFNFHQMCDIELPVPPIEEQRKAVAAWQGLRKMKEENEQLAEPLMQLCRSYLEECKKKWPMTELGPMIEVRDERNSDGRFNVESVRGISIDKKIIETKADMTNVSLRPYKLLQNEEFCVVPVTSRNGGKISMACNLDDETYIVSAAYDVFRVVKKELLLPRFLFLFFSRPEFDRYARFNSWGSARESFSFQEMCRVKIPLPPLEVQQAIVAVYRCASEAKKIAAEAEELSRAVCPALVQMVSHTESRRHGEGG